MSCSGGDQTCTLVSESEARVLSNPDSAGQQSRAEARDWT